ncbi:MAG: hypothetical protein ACR9NN_10650 [Nostochopsis sp.]
MPIPHFIAAIGHFIGTAANRVISVVAVKNLLKPSSNKSKSSTNSALGQKEIAYLQRRDKREQELLKIQSELAQMKAIEIKMDTQIQSVWAEREERALDISERTLQLKQQELELAKACLKQEEIIAQAQIEQVGRALKMREAQLQLMTEELEDRHKLSQQYLELIREKEANAINLKLKEIQAQFDMKNWAGILSREEMRSILVDGHKKHRLLILFSPPDIEDCPDFDSKLQRQIRSELKEFIEKYYPLNSDLCPVEFYGKIFKHSVFDAEAKQLETGLAPIPTVIIYTDVTDENMYFHVKLWGFKEESASLTLPVWNWLEEKKKLEAEGKTKEESIRIIRKSIVKIYQLLTAFFADVYYLSINPIHEPRLFQLEDEFPHEWVQSHFDELKNIQQEKLAEYQRELETPKFEPIDWFVYEKPE